MAKTPTSEQGERFIRSLESLALVMFELDVPALMIDFDGGRAEFSWVDSPDSDRPDHIHARPIDDLRRYEDVVVRRPPGEVGAGAETTVRDVRRKLRAVLTLESFLPMLPRYDRRQIEDAVELLDALVPEEVGSDG